MCPSKFRGPRAGRNLCSASTDVTDRRLNTKSLTLTEEYKGDECEFDKPIRSSTYCKPRFNSYNAIERSACNLSIVSESDDESLG